MINASAFIKDNVLYTIGVCDTPIGVIPFRIKCPVDEDIPNGQVNVGQELSPALKQALDESERKIMNKVKKSSMRLAAESLVQRARQGDQNAMGTLTLVRKAAMRGNDKARLAYDIIKVYILDNPIDTEEKKSKGWIAQQLESQGIVRPKDVDRLRSVLSRVINTTSEDEYVAGIKSLLPKLSTESINKAVVTLANGPSLLKNNNPRIGSVIGSFGSEIEKRAFQVSMKHSNNRRKIFNISLKIEDPDIFKAFQIGYIMGLAKRIQAVRLPNVPISVLSPNAGWELGE